MILAKIGKFSAITRICCGVLFFSAVANSSGAVLDDGERTNSLKVFADDLKTYAVANADGVITIAPGDGGLSHKLYHCSPVAMIFSTDATLLCSAGRRHGGGTTLKIWRVGDGKLLSKLSSETDETPVMAFSKLKDALAFTAGSSTVTVCDIVEGKRRWSVPLNRRVVALLFSDDGRSVIATCRNGSTRRLAVSDATTEPK
jgi:WD40 repeat protein